ncbi:DUF4913 domain-containing protein [Nocardia camponoti]|uniref:DUF4913 domain-containing protein n=1 Tax=Nocardia camponoti TaxID=1616106 RepID=A0A917V5J2_9NOCA|nr:DUF4913 domain-containing protein [Nocardia camponoti]GGK39696.1 hypothetical protein GCM10011591_09250 [Nocardia camponoti]
MTDESQVIAPEITNAYPNVVEFVVHYLSRVFRRQVTDVSDTVWCPEWQRHPEALIRLDALWQSWEHYRLQGGVGISIWFLQHADPHMAKLFDPSGPFKYCSVRNGHKEMLASLQVDEPDPKAITDPSRGGEPTLLLHKTIEPRITEGARTASTFDVLPE